MAPAMRQGGSAEKSSEQSEGGATGKVHAISIVGASSLHRASKESVGEV
jgi:hypothetical protein